MSLTLSRTPFLKIVIPHKLGFMYPGPKAFGALNPKCLANVLTPYA